MREWAFARYDDPHAVKIPWPNLLGRGAEHEVYLDPRRNRVIKVTRKSEAAGYGFGISLNHDGRGATAGEYLDRLSLHNDIFNDDVRLEGVLPVVGTTRIVTPQPYIEGDAAEPSQIDDYMSDKGFGFVREGIFYHLEARILVHDLYPRNVLAASSGRIHAIDPAIVRADPVFARELGFR